MSGCCVIEIPETVTTAAEIVAAMPRLKITIYSTAASGTHTFDASCIKYDRWMKGAGGSGSAGAANGGNGGGGGARVVAKGLPVPAGGTAAYTVGAKGTAVSNSGGGAVAGVNGGNTTWDATDLLVTAQGGKGGTAAGAGGAGGNPLRFGPGQDAANGGTGAAEGGMGDSDPETSSNGPGGAQGGAVAAAGAFREGAYPGLQRTSSANGGHGASSESGRGGLGGNSDGNGGAGAGAGAGGGGSGRRTAGTVTSGEGVDGMIVVTEYLQP